MDRRSITFWINRTIVRLLCTPRLSRKKFIRLCHMHANTFMYQYQNSTKPLPCIYFDRCTRQLITFVYFGCGFLRYDHSSIHQEWYAPSAMHVILCISILLICVSIPVDWIEEMIAHHVFPFRCMKCTQTELISICIESRTLALQTMLFLQRINLSRLSNSVWTSVGHICMHGCIEVEKPKKMLRKY
jgi:hypothetical protein